MCINTQLKIVHEIYIVHLLSFFYYYYNDYNLGIKWRQNPSWSPKVQLPMLFHSFSKVLVPLWHRKLTYVSFPQIWWGREVLEWHFARDKLCRGIQSSCSASQHSASHQVITELNCQCHVVDDVTLAFK